MSGLPTVGHLLPGHHHLVPPVPWVPANSHLVCRQGLHLHLQCPGLHGREVAVALQEALDLLLDYLPGLVAAAAPALPLAKSQALVQLHRLGLEQQQALLHRHRQEQQLQLPTSGPGCEVPCPQICEPASFRPPNARGWAKGEQAWECRSGILPPGLERHQSPLQQHQGKSSPGCSTCEKLSD